MELFVVLCTFPSAEVARTVAAALVEDRLAACVNLLPGVASIYRWQGKVESAEEVLGLIKTTKEAYPQLEAKIRALHPYEVPEIVALPLERGLEEYLAWARAEVAGEGGSTT